MGRWGKGVLFLVAAATLFVVVGCSFPPNRVGFIEKLSSENREIARSTRSFHAAIAPLKKGESVNPGQVRSAYQEMEKTIKKVQADMNVQPLPASSCSAKPFLAAYKDYLNAQQKILTDDMLPIVTKVEETGGNAAVSGFVDGQLAKVAADDNAAFAPLMDAQKAYASEHLYTVQSLQMYIDAQKNGKQ